MFEILYPQWGHAAPDDQHGEVFQRIYGEAELILQLQLRALA